MPPKFSSFEPLYPQKLRGAPKGDLLSTSFPQFFSLEIQFPGQTVDFCFQHVIHVRTANDVRIHWRYLGLFLVYPAMR